MTTPQLPDYAAAADQLAVTQAWTVTPADVAGAVDGLAVFKGIRPARLHSIEGIAPGLSLIPAANSASLGNDTFDNTSAGTGASIIADATRAAHGSQCITMSIGATSTQTWVSWTLPGGPWPQARWRACLFMPGTYGAAAQRLLTFYGTAPTTSSRGFLRAAATSQPSAQMQLVDSTGAVIWTSVTRVPTNTWFRVEGLIVGDPAAGQMSCQIYLGLDSATPTEDSGVLTGQNTGGTIGAWTPGMAVGTTNQALSLDDLAVDPVNAPGPVVITPAAASVPVAALVPAPRVFVASAMPRMHLQNVVTGQWLHRDVRGITSPSVTWVLNGPDTYTCVIAPPRPDLLDATGNPIGVEWQTACYLEQNNRILFGGILTSSQFAGPQWTMGFTGFLGYPAGMVYEGPNYTQSGVDSLDVVRYLWSWLQQQPGSNLGVVCDRLKSGVLLGVQPSQGSQGVTSLSAAVGSGARAVSVMDPTGFAVGGLIVIDGSNIQHTITKISKAVLSITPALINGRAKGTTVYNLGKPARYTLRWWNSTDLGSEIANIATETPFEQYEAHAWGDPNRQTVTHRVGFGVPRIGIRQATLRFAEGENITEPVGVTRDGTAYASDVIGLGAGQGSAQIRAEAAQLDGRLRRQYVYTDQTVFTTSRMQARAQRVLAARRQIDTPATVVLRDHPNARFGSFGVGDDILIQQATGWRQTATWARITSIQQDPTTQAMTLTCVRSDSFTYQGTI